MAKRLFEGTAEDFERYIGRGVKRGERIQVFVDEPKTKEVMYPAPVPYTPDTFSTDISIPDTSPDTSKSEDELLEIESEGYHIKIPTAPTWFKRKLQSIFKDNKYGRTVSNRNTGKLDFRRIYKVMTTPKVFTKEEDIGDKQYNVLLLVDVSGSMSGKKMGIAIESTLALIRDMQDIVSLEVAAFNGRYLTVKEFDKKIRKDMFKTISDNMIQHKNHYGGDNHDHIAVETAYKRLLKRKGQKILLVLSDGQPSCGGSGEECDSACGDWSKLGKKLQDIVREIEHSSVVLLSIGILTTTVKNYYTHYIVLNDINKLYYTITGYMEKYIKRLPIVV